MTPESRVDTCRGCSLHFDPDWLVDGLCADCREAAWRRNVLAERD